MIKRDYLERLIDELAGVIGKALGRAREGRHDEANRELDAGYALVGVSALVLDRLDATSVRMLSGEKTDALVKLLEADAEVASLRGDAARAKRRLALAAGLKA